MLIRRSSSVAFMLWFASVAGGYAQTQPSAPGQTQPSAPAPTTPAQTKPTTPAQTKPTTPEGFTGVTANLSPGAGTQLSFQILKWSSDEERAKAVEAINAKGDEQSKAMGNLPTVGYVWAGGTIGYSVKYAYRNTAPDGTDRIVLVTDRQLGVFEYPAWKVAGSTAAPDRTFSVVELHIAKTGKGDGRISFSGPVAVDEGTKTVGVTGYESTPASLTNVKREPKPYGARES